MNASRRRIASFVAVTCAVVPMLAGAQSRAVAPALARTLPPAASASAPASVRETPSVTRAQSALAREVFRLRASDPGATPEECRSVVDGGDAVIRGATAAASMLFVGRAPSPRGGQLASMPSARMNQLERCGWRVPRDVRLASHEDRWASRWNSTDYRGWNSAMDSARAQGVSFDPMRIARMRSATTGLLAAELFVALTSLVVRPTAAPRGRHVPLSLRARGLNFGPTYDNGAPGLELRIPLD